MRMTYAARTWWEERALPRLVDVALSDVTSRPWRELVCGPAAGRVLEVGFASGKNLEYYPPEVSEVLAVEPADLAWERAADRIAAFGRPVRRIGPDGAHLAVPAASVDVVVSAWTMCTIPDLKASVREMHRVLRPGGSVRYVEHVRSDHPLALRIQEGLQPFWRTVAGGCHLARDIVGTLEAAGFDVTPLTPQGSGAGRTARFELVPFEAGVASPRRRLVE